jgi:VIT1/CCC1 family predicted Fe2+/Mn2+ transporter
MDAAAQRRSLENLRLERDAIVLYDSLSRIEKDQRRADAFRRIAANERRHAEIWATRLAALGAHVPEAAAPRLRVRFIIALARIFGTRAVSDLVRALEGDEEEAYAEQDGPDVAAIAADEREHAEIWKRLDAGIAAPADRSRGSSVAAAEQARGESWHRASRSGTLRAAIFGINDGLVSNVSLVMGVAGATADTRFVILAGIAGLLAGAFSMAAGEYISMQSQRELFQRQIELEREEMRIMPEEETRELAGIFRAKGLSQAEAGRVAGRLMEDPEAALDTKVREELGLDPGQLGSAWGAASSSFVSFAIGAAIPLLPYMLATGAQALLAAFALALVALFLVGAGVSLLTGRSLLFSGARQVAIGAAASGITYLVGSLIGVEAAALA